MAGADGDWEVRVRVDLTTRADTGRINTSPTSAISPIVRLQYGCSHTIVIPGSLHIYINNVFQFDTLYLYICFPSGG